MIRLEVADSSIIKHQEMVYMRRLRHFDIDFAMMIAARATAISPAKHCAMKWRCVADARRRSSLSIGQYAITEMGDGKTIFLPGTQNTPMLLRSFSRCACC